MKERIDLFDSTQEMLICEMDKITQKGELTGSSLDYLDKIVDIIKDLDEIIDNEESRMEDYTSRSSRYYNRGSSYRNDYDDTNYYRRGMSSRDNSKMMGGNSRGKTVKNDMVEHLYMALNSASNDEERKRVQKMIDEIENN